MTATPKAPRRPRIRPWGPPPAPTPIRTARGVRSAAADERVLAEFLEASLRVPDLSLPKKVEDAKRQVRRYEHYYQRFHDHDFSYKAERDKLGPAVADRVSKLEWSGALTRDTAWLTDAHRSLPRCRQVLVRSYVFAYYMFDAVETPTRQGEPGSLSMALKQALFEDYQKQVEGNVEHLSKLLETDVPELPEPEILQAKQHVTNLVRVVEADCAKMYGCIQDELLPMLVEPMSIMPYQPGGGKF